MNYRKAQTATEYIVIVAVVIVIALVVVQIIGGFPGIGSGTSKKVTDYKLATSNQIGIDKYYFGNNSALATIRNNNYEALTVNNLTIAGIACNSTSLPQTLNPGQVININCTGAFTPSQNNDPTPSLTTTFTNPSIGASYTTYTTGSSVSVNTSRAWACGDSFVDSRDNKTYTTSLIGTQCWMTQNINVGTMTLGSGAQGTSCSSIQKYCYSNIESNCDTYGGLYLWNQAMCGSTSVGATGICPTGWYIPSHDNFTSLERAVCTSGTCATDFPYDTTTHGGWYGTVEGTTLKSGSGPFKAVMGGYNLYYSIGFGELGNNHHLWTSLQRDGTYAWDHILLTSYATVSREYHTKAFGFSVRCVKD